MVTAVSCGRQAPVRTTANLSSPSPSPTTSTPATPSLGPWPENLEGKELSFPSIDRAVRFLGTSMDTPVQLPTGLPSDIELDPQGQGPLLLVTRAGHRAAQLSLVFDKGRKHLIVQWGVALLDGCAPEDSIPVSISGAQGRLRESPGPWTEIIWPADARNP